MQIVAKGRDTALSIKCKAITFLEVTWSLLRYNPTSKAYESDISEERLSKAGESFKDFDFGDRAQEAKLHSRYGAKPYWGAE